MSLEKHNEIKHYGIIINFNLKAIIAAFEYKIIFYTECVGVGKLQDIDTNKKL